ncbi:MAG: efflux RND transporter permease subunit [Caulobacterales bacterium]
MAMNISAGAIRNPIAPIVFILAFVFAGFTAYFRLPINQLPSIEFPIFTATVAQPGAAPAELETQITQRVEAALTSVEGVRRVSSTITPGVSQTFVELELGADLARAVDDARDALTRIRADLPADINEPIVAREDAVSEPIAYYAVEADGMTPAELSWFVDSTVTRELLNAEGVSQVRRSGGVDREIRVELDPVRLQAHGLTAEQVSRQLARQNADLPGGEAEISGQAQSIRTLGGAGSIEDLAQTRLVSPDGTSVRLADLGTVVDGASDYTNLSRYNGQPAVTFLVQRSRGSSEVDTFDAMAAKIAEIQQAHPEVRMRMIASPIDFIRGMHKSSIAALIEGALLAVLVVFIFLRDWRATVIAAFAIPLSIFPTFAMMEPLGFTLNMITLIALALVAGVLVDDAIVEIENIVRHMRMGKSPYKAALEAADEIGLAVVATSATIIAVFMPVSFMSGVSGQFFKEFGITVAVATFFSLIVARLITPMMAAFFLKRSATDDHEKEGRILTTYRAMIGWAVRRPSLAVMLGGFIFAASILFASTVPFTFIPRMDNGNIQIQAEAPPGATLFEADRVLQNIAAQIAQTPEVEGVFTSLEGSDGAARQGTLYVQLVPREQRDRSSYDVQQELRAHLALTPDYRLTFLNFQGGGRGSDIAVQFVGEDPAAVSAAADRLVGAMRRMDTLADVRSSAASRRPELQVRPRTADAARLGVSASDIATAVRIATSGDVDQALARYTLPDRQAPIRVLLRPDSRANLDVLNALPVRSATGQTVRLDAVADVKFGLGEAAIERRDRQRAVTVSANVVAGVIGDSQLAVFALPEAKDLPAGVSIVASGDTEQAQEMFGGFFNAMLWGIILIYGVLVLLFKDFFHPMTIMTALPLSVGGAFVALMLAGQPLSLFAMIGLVMLMGIVTKNSILLVDFAIEQIRLGVPRDEALMEAGMKRARPIVMTTFAMSAGMIPAAAGWGVDGALRQGMGVAVIGGLMMSTFLSLLFVPAVFVLVDRLERLVKPFFAGLTTRNDPANRTEADQPAE